MRSDGALSAIPDLDLACRVAVGAAEAAGALLRDRVTHRPGMRVKNTTGDIVTDLDLAAEQLIIGRIRDAFPGHEIIAEESGVLGADGGGGRCTWLVDPIDGTNNVAIRLPAYVVGIALCAAHLPVLGVVHDPVAGQTWSAIRRAGAYGPAGRLQSPACRPAPYGPVLAWTQGHDVPLVSWVMLARGDIDGIVGYRAEAVDLPAGALIAMEAGLTIRGLDGRPFDDRIGQRDEDRSFVASHPGNIERLLKLVAAAGRIEPQVARLPATAKW